MQARGTTNTWYTALFLTLTYPNLNTMAAHLVHRKGQPRQDHPPAELFVALPCGREILQRQEHKVA